MILIKEFGLRIWKVGESGVPKDAVYVGRPTALGNPWSHKAEANAMKTKSVAEAVNKFKEYAAKNAAVRSIARKKLKGKDLVCWCEKLPCHAAVLMEIANSEASK